MHGLILLLWLSSQLLPTLQFEAPPELAAVRSRLEAIPQDGFREIAGFLGVTAAGAPIRVRLAPESSELARRVAPWISGFAAGESDQVVIFPARSPGYPDNTLEDVLRHEVAHVLIWRASGGSSIPRWFNEGLAMEVERQRRFQDQTELLYQLITGGETDLERLDRLFSGGQSDETRAYAIAGAFVHYLLQEHGLSKAREILSRVHGGVTFEVAFIGATGETPSHAEADFWRHQRIWTSWVPIVTSTTTLWVGVTLLALLAIYIRHRRNLEIEKQWDEEDGPD
jgi:hypothetical protein